MINLIKNTFHNQDINNQLSQFFHVSDRFSMGDWCRRFEESFAYWQQRGHFILVNSGSSANLALIQALLNLGRLKKGDRVGFSALTWATNVMPLIQLGLVPVPIDVEINTLNVSFDSITGKDIKALFITNLLGLCDNLDRISEYCEDNKIILIEDNCESLGTVYKGKKLGNYGLASTFSFYVGHHLSTIEGGGIATDDKELRDMLKMVRAHGWRRDIEDSDFFGRYTFYDLGYNLRPTEVTGLLGFIQMEYLDEIIKTRESNFIRISSIYEQDGVYRLKWEHLDRFSSFSIPLVCKTQEKRDALLKRCNKIIETRPIVGGNITGQPFFKKYIGEFDCPNAETIHRLGFYVGNNQHLTDKEIITIKKTLGGR